MTDQGDKREPIFGKNALYGGLAVLIMLGGPYFAFWGYQTFFGPAQFCRTLAPEVVKMAKEYDKTGEMLLVDIVEIKEHSKNGYILECSGLGIFSNTMKLGVNFRQNEEYGKLWLSYEQS